MPDLSLWNWLLLCPMLVMLLIVVAAIGGVKPQLARLGLVALAAIIAGIFTFVEGASPWALAAGEMWRNWWWSALVVLVVAVVGFAAEGRK